MLAQSVRNHDIDALSVCLAGSPKPNENDLGDALIVSAQIGNLAAAKLLLDSGAPVNHIPLKGELTDYSPLYAAALSGNFDIVSELIKHGADVNLAPSSHGMTPIAAAIDYEADTASQIGMEPVMSGSAMLLDVGADPRIQDNRGLSANDLALSYSHRAAFRRFNSATE